ncbi:MAG: hypothetical protein PHQ96_07025 [Candidatus Omnitrophica bacterium]|nr:hypothetical protein [Candidatus Omnitrophota bacterium]
MRGFLRVWQELDLDDIEKHLIVVGELSSDCFSCHTVGIDSKAHTCPSCGTVFKYMGFRRHAEGGYVHKMKEALPHLTFIDFEDFKKLIGKREARKLLDI